MANEIVSFILKLISFNLFLNSKVVFLRCFCNLQRTKSKGKQLLIDYPLCVRYSSVINTLQNIAVCFFTPFKKEKVNDKMTLKLQKIEKVRMMTCHSKKQMRSQIDSYIYKIQLAIKIYTFKLNLLDWNDLIDSS